MKTRNEIAWRARQILREAAVKCPQWADKLHAMRIKVSGRMTRCAGCAVYRTNTIKISLPFFADAGNFDTALANTVTHEAAHLIVGVFGRLGGPHGPQWRATHRAMGGTGDRCHTLELAHGFAPRRAKPRVQIPCPKCGQPMPMGPTQLREHERIRSMGGQGYTHRLCPR